MNNQQAVFKIEKNVPLLGRGTPKHPELFQTIKKMAINDSFVASPTLSATVQNYAAQLGFKFATRKLQDGQRRYWKVAIKKKAA